MGRLRTRVRQVLCALTGGHDHLAHFERERMALRCVSCGHETPGWDVTRKAIGQMSASASRASADVRVAVRRIA